MTDRAAQIDATSRERGAPAEEGLSAAYLARLLGASNLRLILKELGVAPRPDGGEPAMVDHVTAWKALNANVERAHDEGHRLFNAAIPNGNFDLLVASMFQGATVHDALRRLTDGARILRPDLLLTVALNGGRPHLTLDFTGDLDGARAVYLEALATVVHCALAWGAETAFAPERVRAPAAIPACEGSFLNLLAPSVRRAGRGVTIVYAPGSGELRLAPPRFEAWHDGAFAQYVKLVERAAAQTPAPAPVAARVRARLLDGSVTQARVARDLAMSVATLRRRLGEEDASFRAIATGLKRDAATVLLLSEQTSGAMAAELGFSDSRCFRRACHAWFGAPPSSVRLRLKDLAPGERKRPPRIERARPSQPPA